MGYYIALGLAILFGIIMAAIVLYQDWREKHPKKT